MNEDNEKYAILKLCLLWLVAQFHESSHFPKIIIAIDGPKEISFPLYIISTNTFLKYFFFFVVKSMDFMKIDMKVGNKMLEKKSSKYLVPSEY